MQIPRHLRLIKTALLAGFLAGSSHAAVMVVEDFQSDPNWLSRDGEMAVAWNDSVGNLAGSLQGFFSDQIVPFPEIDAFHVDYSVSGGPWVGDFYSLYPSNTQLTFDFMASDILPASLVIQISDGVNTFIRNLLPQVGGLGGFNSITIPLAYDASWLGGSALQFSNVLGSVSFIDLQLARNTSIAQTYFVDNFAINNDALPTPPGSAAVPEASTLQFAAVAAVIVMLLRRSMHPHERPNQKQGHEIPPV